MVKEIKKMAKKEKIFLIASLVIFALGVFGIFGSAETEASHTVYIQPFFSVSGTLDSGHNNLTVTASGSQLDAGFRGMQCGENVNDGSCPNHHLGSAWCGPYIGGISVQDPYEFSGGSITIGSITDSSVLGSLSQTSSGTIGDSCTSGRSTNGQAAKFNFSKTINVSSLPNGTYTLTLQLCTTSTVCGTANTSVTINRPVSNPNFSLSVTPSNQVLEAGSATNGSKDYNVNVTCSGGFTGPVALSTPTSLPTGVTHSYSGTNVSCGSFRVLTLTAGGSAPAISNDSFTVTGNGTGVGNRSGNSTVTVTTPPPGEPTFCTWNVTSNIAIVPFIQGPGGESESTSSSQSHTFDQWADDSRMTQTGTYALYVPSNPANLGGWHSPTITPYGSTSGTESYSCNPSGGDVTTNISVNYQPPGNPVCSDGLDNDGDGFTDLNDCNCIDANDTSESSGGTCGPDLSCSASPSSVNTGDPVTFTAVNGQSGYSWSFPGGSPSSGTGASAPTTYSTTGTKTASVTSAGQTRQCSVTVGSAPSTYPCIPETQTRNVGQAAYLSASGNGSWYSPGATPQNNTGLNYSPVYSTPGLKSVSYTRLGQTDTCTVNVVGVPDVELKVNGADSATINHNQSATLSWTTANSPASCTASASWSGSKAIGGGSESTGPQTGPATKTYTITCSNSAGSKIDSVTLNVNPPPTGTINVTSNVDTTWQIMGGANPSQSTPLTSKTYTNQEAAPTPYTFNPANLAGYTKSVPTPSQTLTSGGTINFSVTYTAVPDCEDGVDNDGDGLVDGADPGCSDGGDDDDETDPPEPESNPQCRDGIDNEDPEDTLIDFGADPGCESAEDDDETDTGPPPESGPDFSLLSSNNLTIDKDAGQTTSNTTTLRIQPSGGFSSNVALSILSGPSVTYNFSDTTITSGEYSSGETMSVTIDPSFPRGNYPIVVQGTGGGLTRTRTVILSVNEQGQVFEEF